MLTLGGWHTLPACDSSIMATLQTDTQNVVDDVTDIPSKLGLTPIRIVDTEKKGSYAVDSYLSGNFVGLGTVFLSHIEIIYVFTAAGQQVKAGFTSTSCGEELDDVAMEKEGLFNVAVEDIVGRKMIVEMRPDGRYSRQIRPISSDKPNVKFMWEFTDGVAFKVYYHVLYDGLKTEKRVKTSSK